MSTSHVNDPRYFHHPLGSSGRYVSGMADDRYLDIMDDLVLSLDADPKMHEKIREIDALAQQEGVSFYVVARRVLAKVDCEKNAQVWMHGVRERSKEFRRRR